MKLANIFKQDKECSYSAFLLTDFSNPFIIKSDIRITHTLFSVERNRYCKSIDAIQH